MGSYSITPLKSSTVLMGKLYLMQRCIWEYAQRNSCENMLWIFTTLMAFFLFYSLLGFFFTAMNVLFL